MFCTPLMTFVCLPLDYVMQIDLSMYYSAKNAQVATSLLTSCNNLLQQGDIRMRSYGLRRLATTGLPQFVNSLQLLQVVNKIVAS